MKKILMVGLGIFLCSSVFGATFEEGLMAYYMKDYAAAAEIIHSRAKLGHTGAQLFLGKLYAAGKGVPKNNPEAVKWWLKAADKGVLEAQFRLGFAYSRGEGIPKDYQKAVKWWTKAAESGYAMAQSSLGYAYAKGEGVTKDSSAATKWWAKAAEQGQSQAQCLLGMSFASGTGIPQDYGESYFWLYLAADENSKYEEARDQIASELTPSKVREIKVRCKKWLKDFDNRK